MACILGRRCAKTNASAGCWIGSAHNLLYLLSVHSAVFAIRSNLLVKQWAKIEEVKLNGAGLSPGTNRATLGNYRHVKVDYVVSYHLLDSTFSLVTRTWVYLYGINKVFKLLGSV